METRTKLAAAAAGSVLAVRAAARARRRARAAAAAKGFVEDIMPSVLERTPSVPKLTGFDEAHAPGHQHLPLEGKVSDQAEPRAARSRPFAKHRHGLRHPGRG